MIAMPDQINGRDITDNLTSPELIADAMGGLAAKGKAAAKFERQYPLMPARMWQVTSSGIGAVIFNLLPFDVQVPFMQNAIDGYWIVEINLDVSSIGNSLFAISQPGGDDTPIYVRLSSSAVRAQVILPARSQNLRTIVVAQGSVMAATVSVIAATGFGPMQIGIS